MIRSVAEFVTKCLSCEQYAFSWYASTAEVSKTDIALRHKIFRLSRKKELVTLRQGFYLILPPRYRAYGKIPLELFVETIQFS